MRLYGTTKDETGLERLSGDYGILDIIYLCDIWIRNAI